MAAVEDPQKLLKDVVTPDLKALDARLVAIDRRLDGRVDSVEKRLDGLDKRSIQ